MPEWIWVSCCQIKIITVKDAFVLLVKTYCLRCVQRVTIKRYITTMEPIHTQTHLLNIHDTQVSQTPHQIHHAACKQVSLWDITCILDVAIEPHQRETAENRRETIHIVY